MGRTPGIFAWLRIGAADCMGGGMKGRVVFVTGTDTGVGKTVLTCVLARRLRQRGLAVAALKPVCSGGRTDARLLRAATGAELGLDDVNPWHFRPAVAPLLAARQIGLRLRRTDVLARIVPLRQRFDYVLVEGAGGLLSPLGEDFDSRDLIVGLDAWPVVVCPDRLGAINQVLLVIEALSGRFAARAQVVLMSRGRASVVSRGNRQILAERLGAARVHMVPRLARGLITGRRRLAPDLGRTLDRLVGL